MVRLLKWLVRFVRVVLLIGRRSIVSVELIGIDEGEIMRRHKLSRGKSRRMFTKHASHPHPMNGLTGAGGPMRGGIRL